MGAAHPVTRTDGPRLRRWMTVAVVVASSVLGPATRPPAGAQPTTVASPAPPTASPAPTVPAPEAAIPVPPPPPLPPLDLATLSVVGEVPPAPGATVKVRVSFRSPFSPPEADYRLSVLVGDPLGARIRVSLLADAGNPVGRVEAGNGFSWTPLGATPVELVDDAVVLHVPTEGIAPGAAVWAEAVLGPEPPVVPPATPTYPWAAFIGESTDGAQVAGRWGWTATPDDRAFYEPVPVPGEPANLRVLNGALIVEFPDRVPEAVLGQPVVGAVTYVRVGSEVDRETSDHLLINRITGVVQLVDGAGGTPVEVPEEESWLGEGLPGDDRGGPGSVSVDLEQVGRALGVPVEPGSFRIRADQVYSLADDRRVVVSGVTAPLAWFEGAVAGGGAPGTTPLPAVSGSAGGAGDELDWRPILVGGGIGLALVLAVAVPAGVVRRRRRRREAELVAAARSSGPLLRVGPAPAEVPRSAPGAVTARPERGSEGAPSPEHRARQPEEVLAAFEAQIGALLEQADRLGGPQDPQDGHRRNR